MRRLVVTLLVSLAAVALLAPAGTPRRASSGPASPTRTDVQFTPHGPVAINVLTRAAPGRADDAGAGALERYAHRPRDADRHASGASRPAATTAGVNGDFFTLATGRAERHADARRARLLSPPTGCRASAGVTTDGTLDVRRVAIRRAPGTGAGPQHPRGAQQPPPATALALYTAVRGGRPRRPSPGAAAVILFPFPGRDPERRPAGAGRRGAHRRRAAVADPARRRGARRARTQRLRLLPRRPVGQLVRPGSSSSPTGRASSRRSAAARRSSATARPSSARARLHDEPARAARAAERRRPARRRPDRARHRRRPPARLLRRHDQLRARPGARPARRRHRDGARQRRLDDDGLRRDAAQPSRRTGRSGRISTALMLRVPGVFVHPAVPVVSPNGDGVDDVPASGTASIAPRP